MIPLKHNELWSIAKQYGTPLYVYDLSDIEKKLLHIKNKLNGIEVAYCLKANPNIELCKFISKKLSACDVSSSGELKIAKNAGFDLINSVFTGPGKTVKDIELGISYGIGTFVVESIEELLIIENICKKLDIEQRIIFRLNIDGWENHKHERMVGSTKFGLEYEYLINKIRNLSLNYCNTIGLHIYEASEIMDPVYKARSTIHFLELVNDFEDKTDIKVRLVDIGGGYGINYVKKDENFDFETYWKMIRNNIKELINRKVRVITEVGRYIVARCGYYISEALYMKKNKEDNFIITNGGINHFIRQVITGDKHSITAQKTSIGEIPFRLCGNLCTPIDEFGVVYLKKYPRRGELFSINDVGAYGLTLSPLLFLSQPFPKEVIIYPDGHTKLASQLLVGLYD